MNRNKSIWIGIAVVAVGIAFFVGRHASNGPTPADNSYEAALSADATRLNIGLPKMVDSVTRLETVAAGPGNRFTYDYTITDADQATAMKAEKLNALRTKLTADVCSNMMDFRAHKTLVVYRYKDPAGGDLVTVPINTADCPD